MDVWYSTWKKKSIFFSKNCSCWKKRAYYEKKAKEKQAEYHGNQYDKKVELHQIWRKSKIIAQIMKQIQNLQN